MRIWLLACLMALLGASGAMAQTPLPVTPGYLTTTGCVGVVVPCFIPFGAGGGSGPGSNTTLIPSSSSNAGIVAQETGTASATQLLKGGPGNLYSAYGIPSANGFFMVFNVASVGALPADGTVAPQDCFTATSGQPASINYGSGPPEVFTTGGVMVFSTGANCFTKTTSTGTAFMHGSMQ